jgi:tRNA A37 threonylcarbamoyladenosine synthetase subunit TsaC/SUA5/YrdC
MSHNEIKEALEILKKGGLIICNTDTIPALACDATNPDAVADLLDLTDRPEGCGLVVLACDMDMVARHVKTIPPIALEVAEVSATPLTIIYPHKMAQLPYEYPTTISVQSSHAGSTNPLWQPYRLLETQKR